MSLSPKTCHHCGHQNPDTSTYCGKCGRPLRPINDCELLNLGECPTCGRFGTLRVQGTVRPVRHLKCSHCGKNFSSIEVFLIHPDALTMAQPLITRRLY